MDTSQIPLTTLKSINTQRKLLDDTHTEDNEAERPEESEESQNEEVGLEKKQFECDALLENEARKSENI